MQKLYFNGQEFFVLKVALQESDVVIFTSNRSDFFNQAMEVYVTNRRAVHTLSLNGHEVRATISDMSLAGRVHLTPLD